MNSSQERRNRRRQGGRSRRADILAAATERFGRDGYEHTKWADIARDVGVGPTALYHYFESKQHCLYEIMDDALADFRARFDAITAHERDPARALAAVIADSFALSDQEVLRNRVLVAEQGLLSRASTSEREEQARQAARARTRDLEFAWASFLAAAMREDAVPESDPRLLTRAVLGLYNSIWHWYRPNGLVALAPGGEYFTKLALAIVGVPPTALEPQQAKADARAA
jgi:TetR/AcrR family transcriptional regulator, cholesterol catabolism regulator